MESKGDFFWNLFGQHLPFGLRLRKNLSLGIRNAIVNIFDLLIVLYEEFSFCNWTNNSPVFSVRDSHSVIHGVLYQSQSKIQFLFKNRKQNSTSWLASTWNGHAVSLYVTVLVLFDCTFILRALPRTREPKDVTVKQIFSQTSTFHCGSDIRMSPGASGLRSVLFARCFRAT